MGRKNRQKEDEQRQRVENAEYALRRRTPALLQRPDYVTEFAHFPQAMRERVTRLHEFYVHAPHTWAPRIKSKDGRRRFLDAIEYIFFERYQVPQHLKNEWLQGAGDFNRIFDFNMGTEQPNFLLWYVIAARGGSLYKEVTRPYLSKQELHYFLNVPPYISASRGAYWYAIARPHGDHHAALHVAMSRISGRAIVPTGQSPWQDIARYFARNPTNFHEISDLSDYIAHEIAEGNEAPLDHPLAANRRAFTLKGRTLATLRRRQEEWHRALRKQKSIGGGNWPGMSIPDKEYRAGGKTKKAVWRFRQIKTGDTLFKEGQRMHHCVAGYKSRCMSGQTAIWSLTYEFPLGVLHRGLTIQVDGGKTIVQVRGYANRQPAANERDMVRAWASEHGLTWNGR